MQVPTESSLEVKVSEALRLTERGIADVWQVEYVYPGVVGLLIGLAGGSVTVELPLPNRTDRHSLEAWAQMAAIVVGSKIRDMRGDKERLVHLLRQAKRDLDAVQQRMEELVQFAREAGISWAQIGEAVGITGQAAHSRWRSMQPSRTGSLA